MRSHKNYHVNNLKQIGFILSKQRFYINKMKKIRDAETNLDSQLQASR